MAVGARLIAAIGQGEPPPAGDIVDHSGMLILPGLVDGHMHTSSAAPAGRGSRARRRSAAAGGVTTCVDMPYDVPQPVDRRRHPGATRSAVVEATAMSTWRCTAPSRKDGGVDAIAGLAEAGICAFKLSTYEYDAVRFPRIDHPTMLAAFAEIAKTGLSRASTTRTRNWSSGSPRRPRPPAGPTRSCTPAPGRRWPRRMADLEIFEIGARDRRHVHIAHSSARPRLRPRRAFRGMGGAGHRRGLHPVPLHDRGRPRPAGGRGKCNPPFRTADEVERMWERLLDGKVAYVSTDHAPWPLDRKITRRTSSPPAPG